MTAGHVTTGCHTPGLMTGRRLTSLLLAALTVLALLAPRRTPPALRTASGLSTY